MLVLSRKTAEQIVLPGCGVTITVLEIVGHRVRLGISAPPEIGVVRSEIAERPARQALSPQKGARPENQSDGSGLEPGRVP